MGKPVASTLRSSIASFLLNPPRYDVRVQFGHQSYLWHLPDSLPCAAAAAAAGVRCLRQSGLLSQFFPPVVQAACDHSQCWWLSPLCAAVCHGPDRIWWRRRQQRQQAALAAPRSTGPNAATCTRPATRGVPIASPDSCTARNHHVLGGPC